MRPPKNSLTAREILSKRAFMYYKKTASNRNGKQGFYRGYYNEDYTQYHRIREILRGELPYEPKIREEYFQLKPELRKNRYLLRTMFKYSPGYYLYGYCAVDRNHNYGSYSIDANTTYLDYAEYRWDTREK